MIQTQGWAALENVTGLSFPHHKARAALSSEALAAASKRTENAAEDLGWSQQLAPEWLQALCLPPPQQQAHWDRFYARASTHFFKDRNVLRAVFPALMPSADDFDAKTHCPPLAPRCSTVCAAYQAAAAEVDARLGELSRGGVCSCCRWGGGSSRGADDGRLRPGATTLGAAVRGVVASAHAHGMSLVEVFVWLDVGRRGKLVQAQVVCCVAPAGLALARLVSEVSLAEIARHVAGWHKGR